MSTLNVDEIRDEAGSTTTPPNIPGLKPQIAQAWVNFNGTGVVAIRDSFNVSSITDNGVGNYTVNFTTSLSNSNYAPTLATDNVGNLSSAQGVVNLTNSSYEIRTHYNATTIDLGTICSSVFSN